MRIICYILLTISLVADGDLKDRYIVLLDEENRTTFEAKVAHIGDLLEDDNRSASGGGEITSKLDFIGALGAKLTPEALETLREDPIVDEIVPVTKMWFSEVQKDATWGLSRISSKQEKRETPYTYNYNATACGKGISVYVIDTGINISHEEFEGRASWGVVIPDGASKEDKNGHGTHCAGIIAGKTYGVAKKASVIAVKVSDDNGDVNNEDLIRGLEWAVKDAKSKGIKAVLSISLISPRSRPIDIVVEKAFEEGMVVVVGAGNNNGDSCNMSPAGSQSMVTVGSIDIDNKKSWFSNFGKCVKILAPGSKILSAGIINSTSITTKSGTSMATPHVAGQVAALWSESKSSTNEKIIDKLYSMSLKNQTTGWNDDTINRLLYNGK